MQTVSVFRDFLPFYAHGEVCNRLLFRSWVQIMVLIFMIMLKLVMDEAFSVPDIIGQLVQLFLDIWTNLFNAVKVRLYVFVIWIGSDFC